MYVSKPKNLQDCCWLEIACYGLLSELWRIDTALSLSLSLSESREEKKRVRKKGKKKKKKATSCMNVWPEKTGWTVLLIDVCLLLVPSIYTSLFFYSLLDISWWTRTSWPELLLSRTWSCGNYFYCYSSTFYLLPFSFLLVSIIYRHVHTTPQIKFGKVYKGQKKRNERKTKGRIYLFIVMFSQMYRGDGCRSLGLVFLFTPFCSDFFSLLPFFFWLFWFAACPHSLPPLLDEKQCRVV